MAVVRKTASKTKTRTTTKTAAKPAAKRAASTRTAAKPVARTRKAVTPTPTRTARAANAGKTTTKSKSKAPAKTTATRSKNVKTVAKPAAAPRTGPNRVVDETTGFAVGTDSHVIAMELLQGGADRSEIIERCAKKLPPTSNRGTPKPVANMVASVLGKMKDQGFTISSTWVLEPPTRASKAKATRARNARLGK